MAGIWRGVAVVILSRMNIHVDQKSCQTTGYIAGVGDVLWRLAVAGFLTKRTMSIRGTVAMDVCVAIVFMVMIITIETYKLATSSGKVSAESPCIPGQVNAFGESLWTYFRPDILLNLYNTFVVIFILQKTLAYAHRAGLFKAVILWQSVLFLLVLLFNGEWLLRRAGDADKAYIIAPVIASMVSILMALIITFDGQFVGFFTKRWNRLATPNPASNTRHNDATNGSANAALTTASNTIPVRFDDPNTNTTNVVVNSTRDNSDTIADNSATSTIQDRVKLFVLDVHDPSSESIQAAILQSFQLSISTSSCGQLVISSSSIYQNSDLEVVV
ncbi:6835_t:CDS:2 [Paraglomus occultum]|uniref:6835_t:CDS:1 n=1 Tax=Paraglomus occultum TaxID=144539 RepID=A0A9N8W9F3_9GLOM|nr:6835_t:CDS:2 [Paraglomus occultum]